LSATKAFGTSPGLLVGAGHHGGVGHGRMPQQDRLQLGRRDLEPLVPDQLLDPVHHVHVAIGVEVADVAGAQPAIAGQGRGRLVGAGN